MLSLDRLSSIFKKKSKTDYYLEYNNLKNKRMRDSPEKLHANKIDSLEHVVHDKIDHGCCVVDGQLNDAN